MPIKFASSKSLHLSDDGLQFHCLHWECTGEITKAPLVLIHGFSAHAHWWDHVAAELLENREIWAIDMYGMGDSPTLPEYSGLIWSKQLKVLVDHIGEKVDLIAHSMGGTVAVFFVSQYSELVEKCILLDAAPLRTPEKMKQRGPAPERREVSFNSQDRAISFFRLIPPQPAVREDILEHIAKHSYRCEDNGMWVLKADPKLPNKILYDDPTELFAGCMHHIEWVCAEHSTVVDQESIEYCRYIVRNMNEPIWVPGAFHHLFIDKPDEVIDIIKSLL